LGAVTITRIERFELRQERECQMFIKIENFMVLIGRQT